MVFNLKRPAFGRGTWNFVPSSGETQPEWDAEGMDWMMAIPVSGTLTLSAGIPHADLCLVAAGKPGNPGDGDRGSAGGNGGEVISLTDIALPAGTYTVTVGASGQDTVLTAPDGRSWTARSGYGEPGGGQAASSGSAGSDGSLAWNDAATRLRSGWLYGASGGVGFVLDYRYARYQAYPGGSVGSASTDENAGHGGIEEHPNGYAGAAGSGQGGGGGARIWNGSYYDNYDGGAGGFGSVLLRAHKEAAA